MQDEQPKKYEIGIIIFFFAAICIFPSWFIGILLFCVLLYFGFKSEENSKTLRVSRNEYQNLKDLDQQIYEAEEELKRVVMEKMVEHGDDKEYVESCISELNKIEFERNKRKEDNKRIKIDPTLK